MDQILLGLAKLAPVIATLVAGIYYFLNKEKKYIAQIEKLQEELRINEKETLKLIQSLTVTMDKVIHSENDTRVEVLNEIKILKETIVGRIESLKK